MKKNILFICFCCTLVMVSPNHMQAQNYKTALGVRLGPDYGLTLKHFVGEKVALEVLATARALGPNLSARGWGRPGFNFAALCEWNFPIGDVEGFRWLVGVGAHVGYWGSYFSSTDYINTGPDAMIGLEYTFVKIPLTLQLDWKPSVNVFQQRHWRPYDFGLSARYVFSRP